MFIINTPFCSFSQALDHVEQGDIDLKTGIEFFFEDSDSLIYYINKASIAYEKGESWEKYIYTLNILCSNYYVMNNDKMRYKYASLAFEKSKEHLDKTNQNYALSLANHSFYLKDIGDYSSAISKFREALEIEKNNSRIDYVVSSLKNIGDAYNDLGDNDQAIKYFNECLEYNSKIDSSLNDFNEIAILKNKGKALIMKNKLTEASKNLKLALEKISIKENKKESVNAFLHIDINFSLSQIFLKQSNIDSLKHYISNANKSCTGDYKYSNNRGEVLLGKFHLKNNNPIKAVNHFYKANQLLIKEHKEYKNHISFSEINNLLGLGYLAQKEYKKATHHFKYTIANLLQLDTLKNSYFDSIKNHIINPSILLDAYSGLGSAQYNQYLESKNESFLSKSIACYNNANDIISEVRKSYQQDNSLLRLSEKVIPIYEASIEASLEMYYLSEKEKYLNDAFFYNEKSKAILLQESINKSTASEFSNIPDSLLAQEKFFKLQISRINKLIYDEQNLIDAENDFKINQLESQLFKRSEDYNALVRKFETEYPKYFEFKYSNNTTSVKDIQSRLSNSNAQIIEFFTGRKYTYIFSISSNKIEVNTIPNNENFNNKIHLLKDFLSSPPESQNIKAELENYVLTSKSIFDTFIKKSIFPESDHLILITDGALGYLPFEALVTKSPKSEQVSFSLDNLSYLFEEYDISYSYSASLFIKNLNSKKREHENLFFGVAPSFGLFNGAQSRVCKEYDLYSLQCSEHEVLQIKEKLGGEVLIGKDATLSNLKDQIPNARIIHLATHACLDDANPEFNKIYLSDDYLSNNDLYNLKLNSELAVLSACETGSGQLAKGEGVMSIARGFIHAGCPSIIMSLWSIDDCATSKVMINFYDELVQGKSKTRSLKNAKIKYISEAKRAFQHPYYWAAFVQIGNYNPIVKSSKYSTLYYLVGLTFFISMLIFLKNKFKNS